MVEVKLIAPTSIGKITNAYVCRSGIVFSSDGNIYLLDNDEHIEKIGGKELSGLDYDTCQPLPYFKRDGLVVKEKYRYLVPYIGRMYYLCEYPYITIHFKTPEGELYYLPLRRLDYIKKIIVSQPDHQYFATVSVNGRYVPKQIRYKIFERTQEGRRTIKKAREVAASLGQPITHIIILSPSGMTVPIRLGYDVIAHAINGKFFALVDENSIFRIYEGFSRERIEEKIPIPAKPTVRSPYSSLLPYADGFAYFTTAGIYIFYP